MKETKPRKLKKRIFKSWITSLVSMSLVLVMLGTLVLILINTKHLSDYIREKIGFTLVLKEEIKEAEVIRLQKIINASDYVKSTRFIDKETAAQELTESLGENFTEFLGYNPLFASLDVKLYAPYTNADSLVMIEKRFKEFTQIKEVYYQKNLVTVINQNAKKISLILLIISALLLIIFIALINNTFRISIYSQRFTINTMQMVGAENAFIRRPFLQQALLLGIYGALVANAIILAGIFMYKKELNGIISMNDLRIAGIVFGVVLVLGILISCLSTFFVVNKFLKMKFDDLFY